eukprot:5946044-Prymnesium_polylepis.1
MAKADLERLEVRYAADSAQGAAEACGGGHRCADRVLPSGVAETTGGGGGQRHATWDGAVNACTADGNDGRSHGSRGAGDEWQQWLHVSCCGVGC